MSSHQTALSTTTQPLLGDREQAAGSQRIPDRRLILNNRAHGTQTELILFEGGWLSIRRHGWQASKEARLINLKHLDPKPYTHRKTARLSLVGAIGLFGCATVAALLALFSASPGLIIVTTIGASIAAGAMFASYVYRSEEVAVFSTAEGRTPAIELFASPGCRRRCRAISAQIRSAIEAVRTQAAASLSSEQEERIS